MRLTVLSVVAVATLSACSEPAPPAPPAETPAQASAEPPPAATPNPGSPVAPTPADECGAAERQGWIGRGRSDLPSAPGDALWRIYETGQPVTQDLRPNRLNIEIDPDSQTVVRLSCG